MGLFDGGILGFAGDVLFGDTGQTKYKVPEYQGTPLAPISTENFNLRQQGLADLKREGYSELRANRKQVAPKAQGPGVPVDISRFTPQAYSPTARGSATIDKGGFAKQMGQYEAAGRDEARARAQMQGDLGLIRAAALGQSPSVAEMQLREGAERAIHAQAAAAASVRGGVGAQAAARRQAAFQASDTMAEANRQAAALRAGEIAQARGELLAGGQALRAGDFQQQGLGLTAAQTALTPELEAARLSQQSRLQNQLLATQAGMQGAQLGTQAGMQTQQLLAQAGLQNQLLRSQVDLANQQAALQARGMQNQYGLGLLGQMSDIEKFRTGTQLGANMSYAQLAAQQDLAQRQMEQDAFFRMHGLNLGVAQSNAAAQPQLLGAGMGLASGIIGALAE